jgi:gliding motility-associated lipoprotein GldD
LKKSEYALGVRSSFALVGLLSILISVTCSCRNDTAAVPKPRAYPRVEYPQRAYSTFTDPVCPFVFEYPSYAEVAFETSFFGQSPLHQCWFDLVVPSLNARIHCSYLPVGERFSTLVQDAFTMANKINQRSNYMDEIRVSNAQGVQGLIMDFKGPAASPMHFYLTDSTTHFFKAALYFNAPVRPDSLQPVSAFIKEDIAHLINTFYWK